MLIKFLQGPFVCRTDCPFSEDDIYRNDPSKSTKKIYLPWLDPHDDLVEQRPNLGSFRLSKN